MTQNNRRLIEAKIKEYEEHKMVGQEFYLQGLIHGLMLAEDPLDRKVDAVYEQLTAKLKEVAGL